MAMTSIMNVPAVCFSGIPETLLLPAPVLPELAYHLRRIGGAKLTAQAIRSIEKGRMMITHPISQDYLHAADILDKYYDSRIDFVDATIMSIAERMGVQRILTFDRRDFGLYRPRHCDAFDLLP